MPERTIRHDLAWLGALGGAYRKTLYLLAISWSSALVAGGIDIDKPGRSSTALGVGLAVLAIFVISSLLVMSSVARLARLLGRAGALTVLLMFVPLINLITLSSLSSMVQEVFGHHDIKVGFMGPSRADLVGLTRAQLATGT